MIQSGNAMFLLSIALGVFVFVQILNGIVNIMTARNMRKHALLQAQMKDREYIALEQHQEDVIVKFSEIMDELIDARDEHAELEKRLFIIEQSLNEICFIIAPPEERKIIPKPRGPYGPRKRKELAHKEDKNDGQI